MHKRSRSIQEKINDCLDGKIRDLHPKFRLQLNEELLKAPKLAENIVLSAQFIKSKYGFGPYGKGSLKYWLTRGWPEVEARFRAKSNSKKGGLSPFSREFWLLQINPDTGRTYTESEADFQRNSRRPICEEYWTKLGYLEEKALILAADFKSVNNAKGAKANSELSLDIHRSSSPRCKEYWLMRGYSENEAENAVSNAQRTFSLDICIEKYGEEAGAKRWQERRELWSKNCKRMNYSTISQELFEAVHELYDGNVYYATHDRSEMANFQNKEYVLKLSESFCRPDFICLEAKKVIEFDRDYWHNENVANPSRELIRDKRIKELGYDILHVKESDFKRNKLQVIEKCINFLKE